LASLANSAFITSRSTTAKEQEMTIQLTATQHAVLAYAINHTEGKLDWFPDNIKGGARKKVLDGLFNRALITTDGTDWFVAAEGYDALGCARPAPAPLDADPELEAAVTAAEATWAQERADGKPRTRENSKQGSCRARRKSPSRMWSIARPRRR